MSLKYAVKLGIPDVIHNHGRPMTLSDLVSQLHIHPSKASFLHRLIHLLVHSGFFAATPLHTNQEQENNEEEEYDLTPCSRLLLKDKLPYLSPFVISMLDPCLITPWQFLGNWFRGGRGSTPFEIARGMNIWDFANHNPGFNNLYQQAMAGDSGVMNLIIIDCKPIFEGLGSFVDVRGGRGIVARIITEAFPQLKCTVLDLPHGVANLQDTQNLKFLGGDMFQSIPPADALLLKACHSYSNEECLKILKKCQEAITSNGGNIIIIDILINKSEDKHKVTETKLLIDMLMMNVASGRERSEKDWKRLFSEAGFSR